MKSTMMRSKAHSTINGKTLIDKHDGKHKVYDMLATQNRPKVQERASKPCIILILHLFNYLMLIHLIVLCYENEAKNKLNEALQ